MFSILLRLRSFFISFVVHSTELSGLLCYERDIKADVTRVTEPLRMDHASLIDYLVLTDQSVAAVNSLVAEMFVCHTLGQDRA